MLSILVLQYTDLLNLHLSFCYLFKENFIKHMKIAFVKLFLLVNLRFCWQNKKYNRKIYFPLNIFRTYLFKTSFHTTTDNIGDNILAVDCVLVLVWFTTWFATWLFSFMSCISSKILELWKTTWLGVCAFTRLFYLQWTLVAAGNSGTFWNPIPVWAFKVNV